MRSGFQTDLQTFCGANPSTIVGDLTTHAASLGFSTLEVTQVAAWQSQVATLQRAGRHLAEHGQELKDWWIVLEYQIPRRNRRVDVVLLFKGAIAVLEFKTGSSDAGKAAVRQVEDYALDLADFHQASRKARIVPIVVTSSVNERRATPYNSSGERVATTVTTVADTLGEVLLTQVADLEGGTAAQINAASWHDSPYFPVPGILEAASSLFVGHSVAGIAHSQASNANLEATERAVVDAVTYAKTNRCKVACFVTGVPGAGKTLAGLNAVHSRELSAQMGALPVFLSGNGPLVRIVTEALVRNYKATHAVIREEARRKVSTFVQSVHGFINAHALETEPPPDRVVVFDEAQRAWDAAKVERQGRRGRGAARPILAGSEPELLLSILDRHHDWAVFVGLIGGGQEIHDGEAGLAEWGNALREKFKGWNIWLASQALTGSAGVGAGGLFANGEIPSARIHHHEGLHLATPVRAIRSVLTSEWTDAVLSGNADFAREISARDGFVAPSMTRKLSTARSHLHTMRRGTRRSGLLASSGAIRLRAEGLEVSTEFTRAYPYEEWFLADNDDVRSSSMLEVAATEFDCQGLEVDWAGVCWGDDLSWDVSESGWRYRKWRGNKWQMIRQPRSKQYLINKYRVLLTRYREGMVIWIPEGDQNDRTRRPDFLNETFQFLLACGASELAV